MVAPQEPQAEFALWPIPMITSYFFQPRLYHLRAKGTLLTVTPATNNSMIILGKLGYVVALLMVGVTGVGEGLGLDMVQRDRPRGV